MSILRSCMSGQTKLFCSNLLFYKEAYGYYFFKNDRIYSKQALDYLQIW